MFSDYIPNPIAFSVFGIDVRWYGILIALGMVIAVLITYKRAPEHGIESERVLDFVIVAIPAAIVGARLYYIAFRWSDYAGDFRKMLDIRGGGLAIHGGLIFAMIAVFILCRHYKVKPAEAFDCAVPSIPLAQAIGRWGNYFNSEAHGGPTDLPWGIPVNGQMVHPTFLYESIWCFLLFIFLLWVDKRRSFPWQPTLLYVILYSLERFFVEGLRTDSLMLGSLRQAQLLSASLVILGLVLYIVLMKRHKAELAREAEKTSEKM